MKPAKLLSMFLIFTLLAAGCRRKPAGAVTPLHRAAEQGNIEQVQSLIASGADVNAKNNKGLTPLHVAASFGRMDVAELLIKKGANANIIDNDRRTPISFAEDRGYEEIAVFLHTHTAKE